MALRRILLAVAGAAAFFVLAPADGQTTVCSYRSPGGQVQDCIGVQAGAPARAVSTVAAGSVGVASTFQSAIAANPLRLGCALQNTSTGTMYVYVGAPGTATLATSFQLAGGATFNCASPQGLVITDQISVASATLGATYVTVTQ